MVEMVRMNVLLDCVLLSIDYKGSIGLLSQIKMPVGPNNFRT